MKKVYDILKEIVLAFVWIAFVWFIVLSILLLTGNLF